MIEKMLTVSIKNQVQPIHWHDLLEINFILAGEMDVVRNNRTIRVKESEMIVLNRDDVHAISSTSDGLLYVQLHLNLELYNQYIPEIWTALFFCSPENNDVISLNLKAEMKSHISSIVKLMDAHEINIDSEKKIIYYCLDILSSLKMGFVADNNPQIMEMSDEQISRVWKVVDYMYDNHNRKLTLHEVAQHVYISDDYLSKILKRSVGMGFETFLSFIRSEMSVRLLLNTDMSITNISYECGFSAPRYYNAAFLSVYGCTPQEYRKNNKNNFLIEKERANADIIYDENIDKAQCLKLLKKYEILYGGNSAIKKNIELDINKIEFSEKELKHPYYPKIKNKGIWGYNIQRAIADIQMPFMQIEQDVFVWEEHDAIKLLIINSEESGKKEYAVKISGLDTTGIYVYCRGKTPDIPESIKALVDSDKMSSLNRDIIDNIMDMTYEYGEISFEELMYMNIELGKEQIAKIVIQKIK